MNLIEMRNMAKTQGIKNSSKYRKVELAKLLNLNQVDEAPIRKQEYLKRPPKQICVTNINTGKIEICKSLYRCSLLLKKNPGSINHFLTTGNVLKINDERFRLALC